MDSKIYIHSGSSYGAFMGFVRVYRGWDGHWHVIEGLTNR